MFASTQMRTFTHCLHFANKCVHIVYEKKNLKRRKNSAPEKKSVHTIVNRGVGINRGVKKKTRVREERALEKSAR